MKKFVVIPAHVFQKIRSAVSEPQQQEQQQQQQQHHQTQMTSDVTRVLDKSADGKLSLSNLENELRKLLLYSYDESVTESEKKILYAELLKKYLTETAVAREPLYLGIKEEGDGVGSGFHEKIHEANRNAIRRILPKTFRQKGLALYDFVTSHPDLRISNNGEVVVRNERLVSTTGEMSNILDLIRQTVSPLTTAAQTPGYPEFVKFLRDINAPLTLYKTVPTRPPAAATFAAPISVTSSTTAASLPTTSVAGGPWQTY